MTAPTRFSTARGGRSVIVLPRTDKDLQKPFSALIGHPRMSPASDVEPAPAGYFEPRPTRAR